MFMLCSCHDGHARLLLHPTEECKVDSKATEHEKYEATMAQQLYFTFLTTSVKTTNGKQ